MGILEITLIAVVALLTSPVWLPAALWVVLIGPTWILALCLMLTALPYCAGVWVYRATVGALVRKKWRLK